MGQVFPVPRPNPGHFLDVTAATGIGVHPKSVSYRFSPRFADMDNDGHTDITFASDFDNDGDLDTIVVNHAGEPVVYRNDNNNANTFLRINTIGTESNRNGIGAKILIDPDITVTGDEQFREIDGGSNFLSQSQTTAHFGLGALIGSIDRVTITWPSGTVQQLRNVAINQSIQVTETYLPGDLDGDGFVGIGDLSLVLGNWNQNVAYAMHALGDPSGDGFVGIEDLNEVLSHWNTGTPPTSHSQTIPEPASLLISLIGLWGMNKRNHA